MPLYQVVCIQCKGESSHFRREGGLTQQFNCPHCKERQMRIVSVSVSFTATDAGDEPSAEKPARKVSG